MKLGTRLVFIVLMFLCCFGRFCAASGLPQQEVDALDVVRRRLGVNYWKFNAQTCKVETFGVATLDPPSKDSKANITCDCSFPNNTCHIVNLEIKRYNLPGILPPELVNLPYVKHIDFAFNYLNGSLPKEWASMNIEFISLVGNRISGEIPKEFGNMTNLDYLDLESNRFSGTVPRELGKLVNLTRLFLGSNFLSGNLPVELGQLTSLTDFRINDNNFNGTIPDYIQNWKQLQRLEMQASGLQGSIPKSISVLNNLQELRISDINASNQDFPDLINMTRLTRIVLRSCNISGKIPAYIWDLPNLRILDLSFNNIVGELPRVINCERLVFIFLTGNKLTGDVPTSILRKGTNVDLSYNSFTWQSPEKPACQQNIGLYLNLFRSSPRQNNLSEMLPCAEVKDFKCPRRQWHSLYVNSGGDRIKIKRSNGNTWYEGDAEVDGGAAKFYLSDTAASNWGFSSTGDFMDDNDFQNTKYIATLTSPKISDIYTTARLSPLSLTYYRYCMINGSYFVTLHFAELQFTSDNTFGNLGRRLFDIYIQDELVQKDFNIADEASGFAKPIKKQFNATITNNILEIRFYWAGRGTTRIPARGIYGPLISAISVDPTFTPPKNENGHIIPIISGVVGSALIATALSFLLWRSYSRRKIRRDQEQKVMDLQTGYFTLKQMKAATDNFDSENKIGEGGFGPVYKGKLSDGTVIAVKQLSSKSSQGNREFLNEIGMITCFQHPNLVKLYGCCIEGDQLLLVYEYLENNSLSRALFGPEKHQLKLDWPTRQRICIGIAKGLSFLHEESRLKIIHRDIKGTNVLLDRDLNPKISDFGLAKLNEEEKTHVSTRIAGTIGYMAPEYALWGYLTYKADVYSFGIVALEIVSGKHNLSYEPENDCACLLDWACHLQQSNTLLDLVDPRLGSDFSKVEAERMIKVALLCTDATPSLRPLMSEVVSMLEGTTEIPNVAPASADYIHDLRFKAIRDHRRQILGESVGGSSVHRSTSTNIGSSLAEPSSDLYDINMDSYLRVKAIRSQDKSLSSEESASATQFSSSVEDSHVQSTFSSSDDILQSSRSVRTSDDIYQ